MLGFLLSVEIALLSLMVTLKGSIFTLLRVAETKLDRFSFKGVQLVVLTH